MLESPGFDPWVRDDPLEEGHGNPLQYSCLENPHGQRSLAGYSPRKESDTTEWLLTARHSILRTRAFSYITPVQYDNIIVSTMCRSYSDFSVSVRSFIEEESPRSGITFVRIFLFWNGPAVFPCLSWQWQFWRLQSILKNVSPFGFICFFGIRFRLCCCAGLLQKRCVYLSASYEDAHGIYLFRSWGC